MTTKDMNPEPSTMNETKEYPMPTVHLNGTSKEMLMEGNLAILDSIRNLELAISQCQFHGRDYYVQDEDPYSYGTYNRALNERQKHLKNILELKKYIEEHVAHISNH